MATIIHKVMFTWAIVLLFLIFLNLKLDMTITWNWFLVFVPMWLFDCVLFVNVTVQDTFASWSRQSKRCLQKEMLTHCKQGINRPRTDLSMPRKVIFLIWLILKLIFQILLCVKLEYFDDEMTFTQTCVPLWLLLVTVVGDVSYSLLMRIGSRPRSILRNSHPSSD